LDAPHAVVVSRCQAIVSHPNELVFLVSVRLPDMRGIITHSPEGVGKFTQICRTEKGM
jgi:hypothetical protein